MSFRSSFALVPLGDVATFINGDRSTNYPKGDDYVDDGLPFISAADLGEGRVEYSTVRRISTSAYERLRSGKIRKDDILFCLRGSIGKIACIKEHEVGAIASSLVIVRSTDKIDPQYLFFGLSSQAGQQAAIGLNNGAAQPNLSVGELQKIRLPLPPLPTQRRIAGILSAYDELIANNQRRIAILEEMARALYREWFVYYRAPGVVMGEDGVPEGWEVGRLEEVVTLQRGFDLPKADRLDGPVPIIAATGITGYHNEAKVKGPGVVTGRSGTIGEVLYIQEDYWPLNTALWSKAFPKATPLFAYYTLSAIDLGQFNAGAAVPSLNRNDIHGLPISIPPMELQSRFQAMAGAMHEQTELLNRTTANLRRTRDLLLPRLMSGRVELGIHS